MSIDLILTDRKHKPPGDSLQASLEPGEHLQNDRHGPLRYELLTYFITHTFSSALSSQIRWMCSGLISFEEFRQTWKLLSSHLQTDISDKAISDLAESIDFNKDGSIDINEFMEAFRLVEHSRAETDAQEQLTGDMSG